MRSLGHPRDQLQWTAVGTSGGRRREALRLQERLYAEQEMAQLKEQVGDPGLFAHYQREIRKTLSLIGEDKDGEASKDALRGLLAGLAVGSDGLRIALSGLVNHRAPSSTLFVLAPPAGQSAHRQRLALIEDRIPLPGRFVLADPARVASLHAKGDLSAHQIAARLGVSHSAVLAALGKLGVVCERPYNGHVVKGQVPFGWETANGRLVRSADEQQVIRLIRQLHAGGESLRAIARELNRRLVPTKNAGLWQANTVAKILRRLLAPHR